MGLFSILGARAAQAAGDDKDDNARREAGYDERVVIPGREANPESRDSGSGPSDRPGMTSTSSIPVMIRLERAFGLDADVLGLVRAQRGQLDADLGLGRYCPLPFFAVAWAISAISSSTF